MKYAPNIHGIRERQVDQAMKEHDRMLRVAAENGHNQDNDGRCSCGLSLNEQQDEKCDDCEHEHDPDEGYMCLLCGKDGSDYLAGLADDVMDRMKDRD